MTSDPYLARIAIGFAATLRSATASAYPYLVRCHARSRHLAPLGDFKPIAIIDIQSQLSVYTVRLSVSLALV